MASSATTSKQQVAILLKDIVSSGVETKDAIPLIKTLVEAKIFALNQLTTENIPSSINSDIRKKLLLATKTGKKKVANKKRSTSDGSGDDNSKTPSGSSDSGRSKKQRHQKARSPIQKPPAPDSQQLQTTLGDSIVINRSPVLTLWSTVVATRLYPKLTFEEAVSLGSAVSTQLADSKAKQLGIYNQDDHGGNDDNDDDVDDNKTYEFQIVGITVFGTQTSDGLRGRSHREGDFKDPYKTYQLLKRRFSGTSSGNDDDKKNSDAILAYVLHQMEQAADIANQVEGRLESTAYNYYMHIRPDVPNGTKGWGAHGRLYFDKLSSFYTEHK